MRHILQRRRVLVDLLAILFGISSWISINGLWVELPMLVSHLPEQWALPSYLSIIVQIANIGPITYGLLSKCLRRPPPQYLAIVLLLLVGCGASLGLVLGWDFVSTIKGHERSTGLFIAVFFLSLVDCTSSVLFLPYMGVFKQTYLNSYLIGEGLSGFLPSIVALAQGVSGNPECVDGAQVDVAGQARFSTSHFFIFMLVMMLLSLTAFLLLHFSPLTRTERSTSSPTASTTSSTTFNNILHEAGPEEAEESEEEEDHQSMWPLLVVQCLVCCLSNGALPSIQSYSCLPYGNTVYHFAVTLNAMANPLMAFLAFFLPCRRRLVIYSLTVVGCCLSGYILATALLSPDMLGTQVVGGAAVAAHWLLTGAIFSYVKVSVAGLCRDKGYLFSCGVLTQVGSALGALVMFLLVNQVQLFEGYYVSC